MDNNEMLYYINLLREKAHTDKLIVFVGAGVSCNVEGMPNWYELIQKMAESIKYSKCATCKKKTAKCKETCKFYDSYSNDEFLKIPQYVYNRSKKLYDRVLRENIDHDRTIDAPLSNAILELAPSHIITTNYDKLIEICRSVQRDNYGVIIDDKDLLDSQKKKYIIKMHGDIDYPDTIILKESDYLEYSQKHVLIEMFVKSLLADHTILFLGYSLNDYNIKLIISWINYIRTQNKALSADKKVGYIVLDSKKITKTQQRYFENNNIGVINLNKMPLIQNIPASLKDEKGKRLYSFLRIIENASLENVLGQKLSYDEVIDYTEQYKYVDIKNLCKLLFLRNYTIDGTEIVTYDDSQYDEIIAYLKSNTEKSQSLKSLFLDAGITAILLVSTSTNRHESYVLADIENSILHSSFYDKYISNSYDDIQAQIDSMSNEDVFVSCFYQTAIRDYTPSVFEKYSKIEYDMLARSQKVTYLFNSAILEARKTYRHDGNKISKYINGIADTREKAMHQLFVDILDGNYQKLFEIEQALSKLKEHYYSGNYSFLGCSSLREFYKIKRIAREQYLFYFKNTLFIRGYSDLKKILKVYIEAIICTNGKFTDSQKDCWGGRSKKERYVIDIIDLDIITKFISIKDLHSLLQEYKLELFSVDEEFINYIIDCFKNIAQSIVSLELYHRFYDAPNILINCAMILNHVSLNDTQKNEIGNVLFSLMNNDKFSEFFFSTEFPEISKSSVVISELVKKAPMQQNIEIVKRIISTPEFKDYYINSNIRRTRNILSGFLTDAELDVIQDDLNDFVLTFDGKDRIRAIRLLYKHVINEKYKADFKQYVCKNWELLSEDDIFDFAFNDMLDITPEHEKALKDEAISIYRKQQSSPFRTEPDPLKATLELIYILYITEKINNLDELKELTVVSDFLQFFIESDEFDYNKVDFSNYMWENIARRPRFMDEIVKHKDIVIRNIQSKIEAETASEFEKKILYGFLLDKQTLL